MDLSKIFESFNDDNTTNDETSLLVDFSEHPLFWISGFNKVIANHLFFKKYTVKAFGKISPDFNVDELEKAGEELMFRKAWSYIKDIDLSKAFHVDCIKIKASDEFVQNLQEAISYFEQFEEYEKCALLKNIENRVKDFLS